MTAPSTPWAPEVLALSVDKFGASAVFFGLVIVVACLIFPISIPRRRKVDDSAEEDCFSPLCTPLERSLPSWFNLPLDFSTVPVVVVLVLLAIQVIGLSDVWNALRGHEDSTLKPFAIIVLFFSLAYMSISLDVTGA